MRGLMFTVRHLVVNTIPDLHAGKRRSLSRSCGSATRSLLLFESELGWRDAYIRMGAFEANEFPDDEFCILGVAGGYCYLNASVMRVFGEAHRGSHGKQSMNSSLVPSPVSLNTSNNPAISDPTSPNNLNRPSDGYSASPTSINSIDSTITKLARSTLRIAPDFPSMSDLELWEYAEALSHFTANCFKSTFTSPR